MEGTQGSMGSSGGLSLRLGQALFSLAALLFMSVGVEFYTFTAFCFLVTIMGLVIPWSSTLFIVDLYSICAGCPPRVPGIVVIIFIGDTVLSILTLGAACASAAIIDLLVHDAPVYCRPNLCTRYQISTSMAFVAWLFTAISSLCNLWTIASM